MSQPIPISPDSDICKVLTCIPEKFIVDFANGIDVAKDHLRVQSERNGFFSRCYDGFTGNSVRRQTEINAMLIDGVEASLLWLGDLSQTLAKSNRALSEICGCFARLSDHTDELALFSAETRKRLTHLTQQMESRCSALEQEISRIDFEQRAERHLRQVFIGWEAGQFRQFAPAARCFAALEELRWGDFGDYCHRQHENSGRQTRAKFLKELQHRLSTQLRKDAELSPDQRLGVHHWLDTQTSQIEQDSSEALAYLGSWAQADQHPFVFTASGQNGQELPLGMPRICSAERISVAMVEEVFSGD